MSRWLSYDDGRSIGRISSEGGMILLDDEHQSGGRITLKRSDKYVSVSCNIYKWIDHTRFFGTVTDAEREYKSMKMALGEVITMIASNSPEIKVWEAISEFVRRFP
jgi:hypothetical protein